MRDEFVRPFDSIESALEFMVLLETVVGEVSEELQGRVEKASTERHKNGLNLALYKVNQLTFHVHKSRRILNDLTLIRSVLAGDGIAHSEPAAEAAHA